MPTGTGNTRGRSGSRDRSRSRSGSRSYDSYDSYTDYSDEFYSDDSAGRTATGKTTATSKTFISSPKGGSRWQTTGAQITFSSEEHREDTHSVNSRVHGAERANFEPLDTEAPFIDFPEPAVSVTKSWTNERQSREDVELSSFPDKNTGAWFVSYDNTNNSGNTSAASNTNPDRRTARNQSASNGRSRGVKAGPPAEPCHPNAVFFNQQSRPSRPVRSLEAYDEAHFETLATLETVYKESHEPRGDTREQETSEFGTSDFSTLCKASGLNIAAESDSLQEFSKGWKNGGARVLEGEQLSSDESDGDPLEGITSSQHLIAQRNGPEECDHAYAIPTEAGSLQLLVKGHGFEASNFTVDDAINSTLVIDFPVTLHNRSAKGLLEQESPRKPPAGKSTTNKGKVGGGRGKAVSKGRQPTQKDQDYVARRVISARRLKINELKNENEELKTQLQDLARENKLLSRTAAMQDRKLHHYEDQENDMPRLIAKQNEDMRTAREQIRRQKERSLKLESRLKTSEEQLSQAQRELKKARRLVEDKQLDERDNLARKLSRFEADVEDKDKRIKDLERHVENLQKNHKHELGIERARHKETIKEVAHLKEQINSLSADLKDKKRDLEISNIYANRAKAGRSSTRNSNLSSPAPSQRNAHARQNSEPGVGMTPREKAKLFESQRRQQERQNRERGPQTGQQVSPAGGSKHRKGTMPTRHKPSSKRPVTIEEQTYNTGDASYDYERGSYREEPNHGDYSQMSNRASRDFKLRMPDYGERQSQLKYEEWRPDGAGSHRPPPGGADAGYRQPTDQSSYHSNTGRRTTTSVPPPNRKPGERNSRLSEEPHTSYQPELREPSRGSYQPRDDQPTTSDSDWLSNKLQKMREESGRPAPVPEQISVEDDDDNAWREERQRRKREAEEARLREERDRLEREQFERRAQEEREARQREERAQREQEERMRREQEERHRREREEQERREQEERERRERERQEQQAREERERLANDEREKERQRQKESLLAKMRALEKDSGAQNVILNDPFAANNRAKPKQQPADETFEDPFAVPSTRKNDTYLVDGAKRGSQAQASPSRRRGSNSKAYNFGKPVENMHNGKPAYSLFDDDDDTGSGGGFGSYKPSFTSADTNKNSAGKKKVADSKQKKNLMNDLFGGSTAKNGSAKGSNRTNDEDDIFGEGSNKKTGAGRRNRNADLLGNDDPPPRNNSHLLPRRSRQATTTFTSPAVNAVDAFDDDIEEVVL